MFEQLNKLLDSLQRQLKGQAQTEASLKLYETAKANLGKDLTPKDEVPDEFSCMATINQLSVICYGVPIGGDASTWWGREALRNAKNWLRVYDPLPGDVIISATGTQRIIGHNGIKNGHIGVVMDNGDIASNNSKTGLFEENYKLWTWKYRYGTLGTFPVEYYRKLW